MRTTLALAFYLFIILCLGFAAKADQNTTYIQGPALIESTNTTATAAGTTALSVLSSTNQEFTGTAAQTVVLPDATTLKIGRRFFISNRSTQAIAVQYHDTTSVGSIPADRTLFLIVESISTSHGTWDISFSNAVISVGLALPNIFSISGSPVTGTGTLTGTFVTQSANQVFAGPTTGSPATPAFRTLVSADIPSLSYVSAVTATAPLVSSGGLTPNLTCNVASGSIAGCLSATDWTTFNGKQGALTFTAPLVNTAGTVTCNAAGTSQAGCLSATDWNTFNGKQSTLTLGNLTSTDFTVTGGTGAVVGSGVTVNINAPVLVPKGGTGLITATAHGVLLGEGTSAFGISGTGTANQVFLSNGSSTDPSFKSLNIAANNTSNFYVAPWLDSFTSTGSSTWNVPIVIFVSSANATVGAVYADANSDTFTVLQTISSGTILYAKTFNVGFPNPTAGTLTKSSGTGDSTITYTSYRAPVYFEIVLVGGGGGGSGSGLDSGTAGNGGTGANTTFGSTFLVANGGGGGTWQGAGGFGAGGGTASPTGASGVVYIGGQGQTGIRLNSIAFLMPGGVGGSNAISGGGLSNGAGFGGQNNTGGGGGGAGCAQTASQQSCGSGGQAGGYVKSIVPGTTFFGTGATQSVPVTVVIATSGSSGTAGTSGFVGGAGGSGRADVTAYFQ